MSARSPGCSGCQPSTDLVRSLEVGTSKPANVANQPKCSVASSGDFETTGILRRQPTTSAIFLNDTPSSATAWGVINRAVVNCGADCSQCLCTLVRTDKAEQPMTRGDQFFDDDRADPTGGRHEYTHEQNLQASLETIIVCATSCALSSSIGVAQHPVVLPYPDRVD